MYAPPVERFMTAHTQMCLQSTAGYMTQAQRDKLRKGRQYFVKLDMMQDRIGALEYRARERDAEFDGHETARLAEKTRQLKRYTEANLLGSVLYDRLQAKHRNRLRVMSRSPHLQQTFDIFNRGDPSRLKKRLAEWDAGRIVDASEFQSD